LKSLIHLSPFSSLSSLPIIEGNAFYVVVIEGEWQTVASKAFRENRDAFVKDLDNNFLVPLYESVHINEARKIFKTNKFNDPTLIITSLRPDHWETAIKTAQALKICLGGLREYDDVVNMLMKIADLLKEKGQKSFRIISWNTRLKKAKQLLGQIPIIGLISLAS